MLMRGIMSYLLMKRLESLLSIRICVGQPSRHAKEYSLSNHLPFLIPVIFDDELDADFEDDITTKHDKNLKLKYIRDITKDCIFSINMSEVISL